MDDLSVPRRTVLTLGAWSAVLSTGACSVVVDGPESTSSPRPSLVEDDKILLDFTRRPTREAFAMPADRQFVVAERTGPKFEVTIKLPTGTIRTNAFDVSLATTAGGGAGDPVLTHVPKYFTVLASYADAKSAFAAVSDQAAILGLSKEDTALIRGETDLDARVALERVMRGLIHDWLALEVTVGGDDDSKDPDPIQVTYQVDIDTFHNEAVDKVVTDGRFSLDLRTRRPSREGLGFLPTYGDADIQALPNTVVDASITLEQGVLRARTDSISSGSGAFGQTDRDPRGTEVPGFSILRRVASSEDIEAEALANAGVLGLDAASVRRVFEEARRAV